MNEQKMRGLFEADMWRDALEEGAEPNLNRGPNGDYVQPWISGAWHGYQAAAAQRDPMAVAEAVRDASANITEANIDMYGEDSQTHRELDEAASVIRGIDLAAIVAALPTADHQEPVGYMRLDELQKAQRAPYLCRVHPAKDKQSDMIPVYKAPPASTAQEGWKVVPVSLDKGYMLHKAWLSLAGTGQPDMEDMVRIWGALIKFADLPPAAVAQDELTFDDIERLSLALSWMGYATPESGEARAARWLEMVRDLIRAVLDQKKRRQAAGVQQVAGNGQGVAHDAHHVAAGQPEPVAWAGYHVMDANADKQGDWPQKFIRHRVFSDGSEKPGYGQEWVPLFAQPPAVAVPTARVVRRAQDGRPKANYDEGYDHGWNDCRVALLAAAPNHPGESNEMPAPAIEYAWSSNGETYHGRSESIERAIVDYLVERGPDAEATVWVGVVKPYVDESYEWIGHAAIEDLQVRAEDECGECVDGWPSLPKEKQAELGRLIVDFVVRHDAPTFYAVHDAKLYDVASVGSVEAKPEGGE